MAAHRQKPGRSVQDVETPPDFMAAVEATFGQVCWDLAANAANAKSSYWYGPGSPSATDTLAPDVSWVSTARMMERSSLGLGPHLWLQPPYGNVAPFARKAAESTRGTGIRLSMLVPAAVDTAWWAESVHRQAVAFLLRPRIEFVGHTAGFPKGLALCVYNPPRLPSGRMPDPYHLWNWKTGAVW